MFRRYRIVSKPRFILFTMILCIILFTGITTLMGQNSASGDTYTQYHTVTVQSGDTLWSIAEANSDGSVDIRRFVYDIQKLNGDIKASDLACGMQLKVPDLGDWE